MLKHTDKVNIVIDEKSGLLISTHDFDRTDKLTFSSFQYLENTQEAPRYWPQKNFAQLVFVLRGQLKVILPDMGAQVARENDFFALSLYGGWSAPCQFSEDTEIVSINCSRAFIQEIATLEDKLKHSKKACLGCEQRLDSLFFKHSMTLEKRGLAKKLFGYEKTDLSKHLLAESKMLKLLTLSLESASIDKQPQVEPCLRSKDEEAIQHAANYLEKNPGISHTLHSISRAVHLNEFKLKQGFRKQFGTTVFGYLRQKRMDHARQLLGKGDLTVLEAAQAVGYSNPSHFARAFRSSFGVNPKTFIFKK